MLSEFKNPSMVAAHHYLGTWQKQVNTYVVYADFYRREFIDARLPPEKISVQRHFVPLDPGSKTSPGEYALFVGRLAPEKGVLTLLRSWEGLRSVPLRIRGEGPLQDRVLDLARDYRARVELVPRLLRRDMSTLFQGARFLIWPSEGYYETFGLVAIEAFACGVPVVASRAGVMAEIVEDGRTGLHFTQGDPQDLATKIEWAWSHPDAMDEMGRAARAEYEDKYTADRNYPAMMGLYEQALRGGVK